MTDDKDARIAALEAELAAERKRRDEWQATALRWKQETYLLERDAARYRWLREHPADGCYDGGPLSRQALDAAIDAAMKD